MERVLAHRKACNKYDEANRSLINKKKKSKNWYYNKERRVEIRKNYYEKYPERNIINAVKSRSKKKDISFDLTEKWYKEEFKKGCAVTGIPFDKARSGTPWIAHIDKIIPELGYIKDNCRLVCACYNQAKGPWSDVDVLTMANLLINRTTDL